MEKTYVQIIHKGGTTYFYFRGPKKRFGGNVVRYSLGTDEAKAKAMAKRLAEENVAFDYIAEDMTKFETAFSRILRNSKSRARKAGREWTISRDALMALFESQSYCCALTGIPFRYYVGNERGHRNPYSPSLDRIDASGGYTPANTRLVLTAVNYALSDWGDSVFWEIVYGAITTAQTGTENEHFANQNTISVNRRIFGKLAGVNNT